MLQRHVGTPVDGRASGHVSCQRALFDRNETRAVLARLSGGVHAEDPNFRMLALASHYGQTAVSMFAALLPLAAHPDGVDLVDYTQDGMHRGCTHAMP